MYVYINNLVLYCISGDIFLLPVEFVVQNGVKEVMGQAAVR